MGFLPKHFLPAKKTAISILPAICRQKWQIFHYVICIIRTAEELRANYGTPFPLLVLIKSSRIWLLRVYICLEMFNSKGNYSKKCQKASKNAHFCRQFSKLPAINFCRQIAGKSHLYLEGYFPHFCSNWAEIFTMGPKWTKKTPIFGREIKDRREL